MTRQNVEFDVSIWCDVSLGAIVRRTTAAARRTYEDTMKGPGPHVKSIKEVN